MSLFFKKLQQPKLFLGAALLVLFLTVIFSNQKVLAGQNTIYSSSSGHSINNLSLVIVNVSINSINNARSKTSFSGDNIVQSGSAFYITDSSGKKLYQIPATLNLKLVNINDHNQVGTYCTQDSSGNWMPCGDYITPGNPLIQPGLIINSNGTIPYSAYFSQSDDPGTNGDNFIACPSGVNINISPNCAVTGKNLGQSAWTVQSCSADHPSNLFNSGPCVTTLGQGGDTINGQNQTVGLSLPLPSNYTAPTIQNYSNNGGSGSTKPTCDNTAGPLGWILCRIYDLAASTAQWLLTNLIQPLLITDPISTNPSNSTYKIWSNFRIYGNIILVIALLVIVVSEAAGGGLVDAYTAKKVLPRLLAAAILINISVYLVAGLVDITNIIGGGIAQVMIAPISNAAQFKFQLNAASTTGIGIVSVGGGIATFMAGVISTGVLGASVGFIALFLLLPAVLGLLAAFITIILRKAVLLFLILVSPVAFALYCLPNTEKYFKSWWGLLTKTLMVYPIIMIMFAIADILSVTIMQSSHVGSGPLLSQTVQTSAQGLSALIAFVALFLPLAMIPFAFKIAGGTIGKLSEMLQGLSKKTTSMVKGDIRNPNSLQNKTKRTAIERITRGQNRVIKQGVDNLNASGWQRRRGQFARAVGGNVNARMSRFTREAQEREEQESATGDDSYRYASTYFTVGGNEAPPEGLTSGGKALTASDTVGYTRYFDSKGREISKVMAEGSARRHGASEHDSGRNLEYALRKVNNDKDIANYRRAFAATATRLGLNDEELTGMQARAGFEHKQELPSEYFSTPRWETTPGGSKQVVWDDVADDTAAGRRNQDREINELYATRESFRLSSLRDQDVRSWETRRTRIQNQWDNNQAVNDNDAIFYAKTNGLLDQMVQRGVITRDGDDGPMMQSSGTNASTTGVLKSLMQNRRYETTAAQSGTTVASHEPIYSPNEHIVYNRKKADNLSMPPPGGGPPAMSKYDAINASKIIDSTTGTEKRVTLTGDADRSTIPRSAP